MARIPPVVVPVRVELAADPAANLRVAVQALERIHNTATEPEVLELALETLAALHPCPHCAGTGFNLDRVEL